MPKRETPVTDVIQLAQKLVRFQSFGGQIEPVFDYLHAALSGHGFNVRLLDCAEAGPSPVLYAAAGEGKGGLLFAGHLDVASPGTEADWKNGAFAGEIKNGSLCARGICEMKGAVAAFVGACEQLLSAGSCGVGSEFCFPATKKVPFPADWNAERNICCKKGKAMIAVCTEVRRTPKNWAKKSR